RVAAQGTDRRGRTGIARLSGQRAGPVGGRVHGAPVKIRAAGPRAVLVEFESLVQVRNYYIEARRRRQAGRIPADTELIPAARTVLFDEVADRAALARELSGWDPPEASGPAAREVEIPTVYNGPDLADVAQLWGLSVAETVERHTGLTHDVAFAGFAPGFA